ncbi:hypothetical protein [Gimesia fumaroli]|uniref:Uncharacterized protein n=1 Tax=Gimesia fumaroli TaxID=2527976 RepID=A0A518I718_9PLAN|nr:hypothetical protein [Gimesia fumaroli]QDV48886.1 hypothetical protein Enr17x_09010 [Gimesia fumaroli]
MKLVEAMPTFTRWYLSLVKMPRMPYVAFGVACVIGTAITPVALIVTGSSLATIFATILVFFLFVPLWLPVLAGDLSLLYWSEKQRPFRPSLILRLLILALVMEGFYLINHYSNPPAKPPHSAKNEEIMNQVIFMSLYGVQSVLLLVLEPGLRWLLKRRSISIEMRNETQDTP